MLYNFVTKPPGMQLSNPGYIGMVAAGWASGVKNDEDDGGVGTNSLVGVVSSEIVIASASVIFTLHHKTQKMACIRHVFCTFLPSEPTSAGELSDMLLLQCGMIFHLLSGNQAH